MEIPMEAWFTLPKHLGSTIVGTLSLFQGASMWCFHGAFVGTIMLPLCFMVLPWESHGASVGTTVVYPVCFYGASVVTTFSHGAKWFLRGASMVILLCLRLPLSVHNDYTAFLLGFHGESMA